MNNIAETEEIQQTNLSLQEEANSLIVRSAKDYEVAAEFLKRVVLFKKKIRAFFEPMKKKTAEAHKEVVAQEKNELDPAERAELDVKSKMSAWYQREAARIAEANRKAEEAARVEREKAIAEAEARRQAEIEEAAENGEIENVQELEAAPLDIKPVNVMPVTKKIIKVQGISHTTRYDFRVTDVSKLPARYILPNTVEIRKKVNLDKLETLIPGVEVFIVPGTSARS